MALRIFETRYIDMVRACLREEAGFVICLSESRAGSSAPRDLGTEVRIVDFDRTDDGLLGITCEGHHRVSIHAPHQTEAGLWMAETRPIPNEPDWPVEDRFDALVNLLRMLIEQIGHPYEGRETHFDSASWVSGRLAEILPLVPDLKHELLELDDPRERLIRLEPVLQHVLSASSRAS